MARTSRSRWQWTIPNSCAASFSASRPSCRCFARTSVGEGLRQSWIRRVIEPSRKAFEGGSLEDGVRAFMDGMCGNRVFR